MSNVPIMYLYEGGGIRDVAWIFGLRGPISVKVYANIFPSEKNIPPTAGSINWSNIILKLNR